MDEEIYIRGSLEEECLRVNWNTNVEASLPIAETGDGAVDGS
jgi:hypothetical protein